VPKSARPAARSERKLIPEEDMDLHALNRKAIAKRSELPPFNNFTIVEMLNDLPKLFDWVSCSSGHSDFNMFAGDDDGVALRFFWNGSYEKTTLKAWAALAKKTAWAVDIGAHTGAYTLAAYAANPTIKVLSFEPNPQNAGRLVLNLRGNGFQETYVFTLAVGAKAETLPFSYGTSAGYLAANGMVGKRFDENPNVITTNTKVVALDNFLMDAVKPHLKLMKIDTEGYESQVIAGMLGILKSAQPIIFFECIELASGANVEAHLKSLGYRFLEVDDDAGTIKPVDVISPILDSRGKPIHSRANRIALPSGVTSAELME